MRVYMHLNAHRNDPAQGLRNSSRDSAWSRSTSSLRRQTCAASLNICALTTGLRASKASAQSAFVAASESR